MKNERPNGLHSSEIYDIAVIGGGPAGMMAAGRAAERARGEKRDIRIVILEKNVGLGAKLLLTGGGRCNLTNAEPDTRTFLSRYKEDGKFLFSAFAQHGVTETLELFHRLGLDTKVEEGNRVFPVTEKAKSVLDALVKYMTHGDRSGLDSGIGQHSSHETKGGAEAVSMIVRSSSEVTGFIQSKPGQIDSVKLKDGETISARSFILATGGNSHPETGSTGDGLAWLAKAGHTVSPPKAALVPIRVSDSWVKDLSGVSIADAKLTIYQDGVKIRAASSRKWGGSRERRGKILFTHFGLSGPAILNMSSEIRELMKYGEVVIALDLLPEHDYSTLNDALQELFAKENKKKLKNALPLLVGEAFVPVILEKSGISGDLPTNSVTREDRLALVKLLKDLHMHPTGLLGADKAIITSGGVALSEVDFRTMRSRLITNLYLVGDILDIDRPSGGYSLQLCWTTGWVAGNAAYAVLSNLP